MIITRTPLRISFVGGGTDLPNYYEKHGGAVVSMAIDKYIYVCLNNKFDGRIRISYSKTENVDTVEEIKHDIVRACLEMFHLSGVEITSVSDIPSSGSGLGSSSSFTVGLINAIRAYNSICRSPHTLSEEAYMIECGLSHGVGKQDHYAASYGGLNFYVFEKSGNVQVLPICLEDDEEAEIMKRLMLFWTGKSRRASKILLQQSENFASDEESINIATYMRNLAYGLYDDLTNGRLYSLGQYLHENWELKKQLSDGITERWIDDIYNAAMTAGAEGGKICGAGGGGFLLICADPQFHKGIQEAIDLRRINFKLEKEGSKKIYG